MDKLTYDDGLKEGRIRGIEEVIKDHGVRIGRHEDRITAQERITYALLGAIALLEVLPTLKGLLV